jgi:hypothetical protein
MSTTAEHYFRAAGLDTPIGGTDKVNEAIREMSADPKDRGAADRVLAMLFRDANGIAQTASRNSVDLYRQVARRYHLTSVDFHQTDQPPRTSRLGPGHPGDRGSGMSINTRNCGSAMTTHPRTTEPPNLLHMCGCGHHVTEHPRRGSRPCV